MYLQVGADSAFAIASLPAVDRAKAIGVVMCPSFGWDDHCTHRVRRTWSDALADAGHPAIRIDLPGTGDSGGSARDPDRMQTWIAAVSAAANWLRNESGCTRVAGFGIGFGGMLAWAAAAEGAPIDDLMLWAAPTRGRRLVRELQVAAKLNIDAALEFDSERAANQPASVGDELLDEAGQVTTRATLDALSKLDLTALPLEDAARRRVLIFMRSGDEADASVAGFFEEAGAEVTQADGSGYSAMMRYVQEAMVPIRAIEQSVEWLAACPAAAGDTAVVGGAPTPAPVSADTLELIENGVAIMERPIVLEVQGKPLAGVVAEPVGVPAVGLCAVFFSGGSDRRVGPNRMWVETSRRWAARGVHAVRVDPPGIGDSDGDERAWDRVKDHYDSRQTDWGLDLLDELRVVGLPDQFVLSGFCIGAYRSFQVALGDRRVKGMFGIGQPVFFSTWWKMNVRDWWTVDWVPKRNERWQKTVVVRFIQRGIALSSAIRRTMTRLAPRRLDRTARALQTITERGTEVLVLFKADSHELRDLVIDRRINRFRAIPGVEMLRIPGRDARFRPLALQSYINATLDDALERVIGASSPAPSSALATANCSGD